MGSASLPHAEPADGDVRYRALGVRAYPAGHGQEVVSLLLEGRATLAPQYTGALVTQCHEFRSLDEHAEAICRRAKLPATRVALMRRRLESLVQAGLLTRHDRLLERCCANVSESPRSPIETIGMPSCDRVDVLARGLRSYARNVRDHGRDVEIVVIDDSRQTAHREANRMTLAAVAREYALSRAMYADAEDRVRFAEDLAREAGVPPKTAAFAVVQGGPDETSVGACRNALLLHSAGECAVQADDDTICRLARAPGARGGTAVASTCDPTHIFYFGAASEARAAVSFVEQDLLGLYESVLGRSVARLLKETSEAEAILDRLDVGFARRLVAHPYRVAVAAIGVVGDSGLGSSDGYFLGTDANLDRLWQSGDNYRHALESRQVVRAAPVTTLADFGPCMGIGLALDNRTLLPPFSPVMRNEDGVFGAARAVTLPATAMAYLPWVTEHAPPTERRDSMEQVLSTAGSLRPADFLAEWIRAFGGHGRSPRDGHRFEELGRHLVEIGSLPVPVYADRCQRLRRERIGIFAAQVDRLLETHGSAPRLWRQDLATYREALIAASAHMIPADEVSLGLRLVREYGELMSAWPVLVEASRALRKRGRRPAYPVSERHR